ncbi:MAG: hypothetical protein ACR2KK_06145 [Acidimicrobiales bacterium]
MPLAEFAWRWLEERPNLRLRTRELYVSELKCHILPALGSIEVGSLTTSRVRAWHATMLSAGRPGPTTVAKCYRLPRGSWAPPSRTGYWPRTPAPSRALAWSTIRNGPWRRSSRSSSWPRPSTPGSA